MKLVNVLALLLLGLWATARAEGPWAKLALSPLNQRWKTPFLPLTAGPSPAWTLGMAEEVEDHHLTRFAGLYAILCAFLCGMSFVHLLLLLCDLFVE